MASPSDPANPTMPDPESEGAVAVAVEPQTVAEVAPTESADHDGEGRRLPLPELETPEKLSKAIGMRVSLWEKLLQLSRNRQMLDAYETTPEIRSEMHRQEGELKRVPDEERLQQSLENLRRKLDQHDNPPDPNASQVEEEYVEEEDEFEHLEELRQLRELGIDIDFEDDEQDEEELDEEEEAEVEEPEPAPPPVPARSGPAPADLYRMLLNLGIKQVELLLARCRLDPVIPQTAAPYVSREPLTILGRALGVDAAPLVGWTYYAAALEQELSHMRCREQANRERLAESLSSQKKSGWSPLSSKAKPEDPEQVARDERVSVEAMQRRQAIERELKATEPKLNELFWTLYEEVAWLHADDRITDSDHKDTARALLRYGLVARHESLIARDKVEYMVEDVREDIHDWCSETDDTHVVYADELIYGAGHRLTTASPDEDLELNGRASPEWKADRIWRRSIAGELLKGKLVVRRDELKNRIDKITATVESIDEKYEAIRHDAKKRRQAMVMRQQMTDVKSQLARYRQMYEKIEGHFLPELEKVASDAEAKMGEALETLTPEMVVRREARFIRRMARLSARLKTPYPQFVLRDHFEPTRSDHHHRQALLDLVAEVEKTHQDIFHRVLIANRKRERQLSIRLSPTFLIVPACGMLGLSLCPRRSSDSGKMMLPLMAKKQDSLRKMALEVLSDFTWDCSMEEAGQDWITSDALCAAYANVRWEYRSRSPAAQKRAGFNKKNKDRADWRGHYAMYIDSAKDAGRKLFYKCFEVYEVMTRYIGLPDGVERLRKE